MLPTQTFVASSAASGGVGEAGVVGISGTHVSEPRWERF